jgi:hypothetical protein
LLDYFYFLAHPTSPTVRSVVRCTWILTHIHYTVLLILGFFTRIRVNSRKKFTLFRANSREKVWIHKFSHFFHNTFFYRYGRQTTLKKLLMDFFKKNLSYLKQSMLRPPSNTPRASGASPKRTNSSSRRTRQQSRCLLQFL